MTRRLYTPSSDELQRVFRFVEGQMRVVQAHEVARYFKRDVGWAQMVLLTLCKENILGKTSHGYVVPTAIGRTVLDLDPPTAIRRGNTWDSAPSGPRAPPTTVPTVDEASGTGLTGELLFEVEEVVKFWLDRRSRAAQDALGAADIEELVALLRGKGLK